MMDRILLNVENVRCYVDEVVIFSKNEDEHTIHLDKIFHLLKENGLRLRINKCSFMHPKVELLGHMVDKEGIHVDEQKVVKIKEAEIPTSRK